MQRRFMLVLVLLLCLGVGTITHAQDQAPVDPPPTENPTDVPVVAPTDPPTEVPTEIPTDIPTEVPTEAPTDIPTDVPVEVPTDVPTEAPVVSAPPVFSIAAGSAFQATAGSALTISVSVADDGGIVRVVGASDQSADSVDVQIVAPVETAAPFNTAVTVTYTAPAEFSGVAVVTLTAIDVDGVTSTVALTVTVSLPAVVLPPTPEPTDVPTKTLLINYNPAASEAAVQALLAELGAVEVKRIPQIGAMEVLVPEVVGSGANANALVSGSAAAQAAGFINAEENNSWSGYDDPSGNFVPNDPLWTNIGQWGFKNTEPPGAWIERAWDLSPKRGLGVTVAVVDSGVWAGHPDLVGRVLPGYDFINDDADAMDDYGHGTHVAGTIAANTNNAIGVSGAAYNAKILPVKVLNNANSGPWIVIAQGIVYAVDKGAKIINMSLGGSSISTTVQGAVNYALSRGVVVIASAGNTGDTTYNYPASYSGVISVAAHDNTGAHASFSTANDHVTISAPGVGILSTMLKTSGVLTNSSGYGYLDGTSMAAPHVSGVAALLVSAGVATTPAAVREALICGARDVNGGGYDNQMGYGVLDADYAMRWRANSSTCHIPQANDDFETATNIATVPYAVTQAVQARSATAQVADPSYCGTPSQTLWYKYKPTVSGYYQFSTVGSSFDSTISVYRGTTPGALANVGCNDDWGGPVNIGNSLLTVQLVAGQTYYIMVDGFGSTTYDNQVMQFNVRPAIETMSTDVQNTGTQIAYSGTWATVTQTGASGGSVNQTTDDSAIAYFSVKGTHLEIAYTVGPVQGDIEVWVDGVLNGYQYGRAAVTTPNYSNIISLGNAGIHQVALKRYSAGALGAIAIDRVRVTNNDVGLPVTVLADDRDNTRFRYFGTWLTATSSGSNANTVTYSNTSGNYISFIARGSAITIYRSTDSTFGSASVYVDNVYYGSMANNGTTAVKVPYIISGLAAIDHVVRIVVNSSSYLEFDAVLPSSPAPIAAKVDERAANVLYTGLWSNWTYTGAMANGTRYSQDVNAKVEFQFTGNVLCLGYLQEGGGANYSIYVDGYFVDTIVSNGTSLLKTWCSNTSTTAAAGRQVFFTGLHSVQILRSTAGYIELDYIQPLTYNVITPVRGMVQESDPAISYTGVWGTATGATFGPTGAINGIIPTGAKSPGGYLPSGGSVRRTQGNGTARATFFINGTGLILYSSIGGAQGCAQIYVDGVLYQFQNGSTLENGIYLDLNGRYRPFSFGVTNLPAGIHKIEAVSDSDCSSLGYSFTPVFYFDFDGVRVFP